MKLNEKIILGSAQFGLNYGIANNNGKIDFSSGNEIISYAFRNGILGIDTAISYGESEALLGRIGVSEFKVTTKIPSPPINVGDASKWAAFEISKSLKRLRLSNCYAVLIHDVSVLRKEIGLQVFSGLKSLKDAGIIEKIGVSIYEPKELDHIVENYPIEIVQAPYNIFDRRMQTSGWICKLKNLGVEFQARSIFLQGLLLIEEKKIPSKFSHWKYMFKLFTEWNLTNGYSTLQGSLVFVLENININKIVLGVDNVKQLIEIVNVQNIAPPKSKFPEFCIEENSPLINPSLWNRL